MTADVPRRIHAAARRLQRANRLGTFLLRPGDPVPEVSLASAFKYTPSWGEGSLGEALGILRQGGAVTISAVTRKGAVIAYGIAVARDDGAADITIIDVSTAARRSSGLSAGLTIQGEHFLVGAAHLVVMQLLAVLPRPVRTDATHASSAYVFKSLGFIGIPGTCNPCLLHLPAE